MTTKPNQTINLQKIVKPYTKASTQKSLGQVANTLIPLALSYVAAFFLYPISLWATFVFCVLGALLTTRAFIIMHDCGHGSFFKSRKWRDILGTITGTLVWTPYHQWTREHAAHHQHSGNLDYRGRGDVWTMTLEEYRQASRTQKVLYYLYRHPLVTFGIGPIYLFQFRHRIFLPTDRPQEKKNVIFTNITLALIMGTLIYFQGVGATLFVVGFTVAMAQLLGCLLFYVQHQYEEVYWNKGEKWDYNTAALDGCSYMKLPKWLQWFTGNIGFHHIHHLNHKIPNYYLEKCQEENGVFQNATTLTLKDIIPCINLKVYDEDSGTMLTWKQVREKLSDKSEANAPAKAVV